MTLLRLPHSKEQKGCQDCTPPSPPPSTTPTAPHLLCAHLLHELNECKAHGTVGVATDAAVHHRAAVGKECRKALLGNLVGTVRASSDNTTAGGSNDAGWCAATASAWVWGCNAHAVGALYVCGWSAAVPADLLLCRHSSRAQCRGARSARMLYQHNLSRHYGAAKNMAAAARRTSFHPHTC